jgi:hypothetical protein
MCAAEVRILPACKADYKGAAAAGERENTASPLGAQGSVAKSPQDLHKQIRGIEAESPVFCSTAAKNAPKF